VQHSAPANTAMAHALLHQLAKIPISNTPRKVDKPLVLYGAGNLGKMARAYFEQLDMPIQLLVDASAGLYRNDPFWQGITILHPHEVSPSQRENMLLAVCIATSPFSEISASLAKQGWRDIVPFYDITEAYQDQHPLSNGWFSGVLSAQDVDHIEGVLSRWSDDISRSHHLQFIAWHSLREDWHFKDAPVTTGDRYFIHSVLSALHDHEVFVDVGAHHGEVSTTFLQVVNNRFKALWAIEPDQHNLSELRLKIKMQQHGDDAKIHILSHAVGELEGNKTFMAGLGYASQFCVFGQSKAEVKSIDQLDLTPSFIKLHLEGWELNALKGSIKTILQHRPLIAATSYHNRLGLWEFPKWLMDHLSDYDFLLRLHSWCGTGAVIYCIPRERQRTPFAAA